MNILSFDGGGSRGLMEIIIISAIMKLATMMRDNPDQVNRIVSQDLSLSKARTLRKLKRYIDQCPENNVLHPADVFDYIAGERNIHIQYSLLS